MTPEEKYMNEILANGMLAGLLSHFPDRVQSLCVTKNGQATNASYLWFEDLNTRYRVTIEMDPE